ncbi:hypothetical protein GGI35DRAFT_472883 [Trichoderma velutinum]
MAPTFRLYPQLRDAYLIPLRDHAALREKYTRNGGNSFLKRSATSLRIKKDETFQFNFWGVAFNGRVCIVIGNLPNDARPGVWTRTDFKTAQGTAGLDLLDTIQEAFDHLKMDRYTGNYRIRAAEVKAIQLDLEERGPPVALETQTESETAAFQRQIPAYKPERMKSRPSAPEALRALGAPLTANVLAAGMRSLLNKHAPQSSEAGESRAFMAIMKRGHQEMALKLGLLQITQSSPNAPAIQVSGALTIQSSAGAPAIQSSAGAPAIQSSAGAPAIQSSAGAPAIQSSGTVMDTTE